MTQTILALVDDLFFAAKIRGAAESLGMRVVFAKSVEAALDTIEANRPIVVILDLQSARCDAFEFARRSESARKLHGIISIGFFSHVEKQLEREALRAGFEVVLPRSVFFKDLPKLIQNITD